MPWLGGQDMQGWQPHITVQNRVSRTAADTLHQQLTHDFKPRSVMLEGLDLWRYLGAPWQLERTVSFAVVPALRAEAINAGSAMLDDDRRYRTIYSKNSCEYPQNCHEARPERFLRGIQTMRSNNTSVCHSRTEAQSGLRIALTIAAVEAGAASDWALICRLRDDRITLYHFYEDTEALLYAMQ